MLDTKHVRACSPIDYAVGNLRGEQYLSSGGIGSSCVQSLMRCFAPCAETPEEIRFPDEAQPEIAGGAHVSAAAVAGDLLTRARCCSSRGKRWAPCCGGEAYGSTGRVDSGECLGEVGAILQCRSDQQIDRWILQRHPPGLVCVVREVLACGNCHWRVPLSSCRYRRCAIRNLLARCQREGQGGENVHPRATDLVSDPSCCFLQVHLTPCLRIEAVQ